MFHLQSKEIFHVANLVKFQKEKNREKKKGGRKGREEEREDWQDGSVDKGTSHQA